MRKTEYGYLPVYQPSRCEEMQRDIRYLDKNRGNLLASLFVDGEPYLSGFHCWIDKEVAIQMCKTTKRKSLHGFDKDYIYVVVAVAYNVVHATGVDNPFHCNPEYGFPCVVVNDMIILHEVEEEVVKEVPNEE
jgi:hypothetical protein